MAFVMDASVLSSWAFADQHHPVADAAWQRIRAEDAIAPALVWFELRNILIVNEPLNHLPLAIDREPVEAEVLRLARAHSLTVYDAAYLELARRMNAPLAALDLRLAAAAIVEHVPLLTSAQRT